jgi:hypothetical protein
MSNVAMKKSKVEKSASKSSKKGAPKVDLVKVIDDAIESRAVAIDMACEMVTDYPNLITAVARAIRDGLDPKAIQRVFRETLVKKERSAIATHILAQIGATSKSAQVSS